VGTVIGIIRLRSVRAGQQACPQGVAEHHQLAKYAPNAIPTASTTATPKARKRKGISASPWALSAGGGREKRGPNDKRGRLIGRTKGGMNTKLHAICDSQGRPLNLFVTAGQVSDYIGARALLGSLPDVEWLLGDRGYDADWFRNALKDKGIRACIPGRKQRKTPVKYDKRRYKRRNRIEIMFGRLKDWRRVATRYDRCPKVFLSAIALAATVIYWL
jgi:transposase